MKVAAFCLTISLFVLACARTEIIESPKTGYSVKSDSPKPLQIIWTSRALKGDFSYLGQVKVRSWTYDGAVERLVAGAKSLGADAVVDVHYEVVGFLDTLHGFAIKYK